MIYGEDEYIKIVDKIEKQLRDRNNIFHDLWCDFLQTHDVMEVVAGDITVEFSEGYYGIVIHFSIYRPTSNGVRDYIGGCYIYPEDLIEGSIEEVMEGFSKIPDDYKNSIIDWWKANDMDDAMESCVRATESTLDQLDDVRYELEGLLKYLSSFCRKWARDNLKVGMIANSSGDKIIDVIFKTGGAIESYHYKDEKGKIRTGREWQKVYCLNTSNKLDKAFWDKVNEAASLYRGLSI